MSKSANTFIIIFGISLLVIGAVSVFISGSVGNSGSDDDFKYEKIDCDGGIVLVLKNPDDLIPTFASEYQKNMKFRIALLDSMVHVETNTENKNKIKTFREKLEKDDEKYQNILKASYQAFITHPCDKEAKKAFDKSLNKMNDIFFKLDSMKIQMQQEINKTSKINNSTVKNKYKKIQRTIKIINTNSAWNNSEIEIFVNGKKFDIGRWTIENAASRSITYSTYNNKIDTIKICKKSDSCIFYRRNSDTIVIK